MTDAFLNQNLFSLQTLYHFPSTKNFREENLQFSCWRFSGSLKLPMTPIVQLCVVVVRHKTSFGFHCGSEAGDVKMYSGSRLFLRLFKNSLSCYIWTAEFNFFSRKTQSFSLEKYSSSDVTAKVCVLSIFSRFLGKKSIFLKKIGEKFIRYMSVEKYFEVSK